MPAFLELPRELRDKILEIVVDAPAPAPLNTSDRANRTELHDYKAYGWASGSNVYYPKNRDILPLLLVNRQIHDETTMASISLPTKFHYIMDVILVDESEMWTTWLSTPLWTTRVDRINCSFRTMGLCKNRRNLLSGGDGGPPMLSWCLYSILERFFRLGASTGKVEGGLDHKVSVNLLEINVERLDAPTEMFAPRGLPRPKLLKLMKETDINYVFDPQQLFDHIRSGLAMLLSMSYYTAPFGGLLYERIGRVKLCFGGEVQEDWDLAERLASVRFNNSFGCNPPDERPQVFKAWRADAYKTRFELGLPVVPLRSEEK